ncbi:MAG: hypothetical protein OXF89_18115 [Rhodospirillaceae bacterium]|nr:hypothetical protein [Rhodospirillaceae bacterium]
MTLTAIQQSVANILRPHRSEYSYVAGGAALNREWPRISDDMDIFHDYRDRLPHSVTSELGALRKAGFAVELTSENDLVVEAVLRRGGEETRIQWFYDEETCRRFYPALDDPDFGFRLHDADVAVNKVLCAARRNSAPRDAVDLVNIVERYAPLGPLTWAVSGKDPDVAPPATLRGIRANVFGYAREEVETVRMADGSRMDWRRLRDVLDRALDAASEYCEYTAPSEYPGCLFVDADQRPVEADNAAVETDKAIAVRIRNFSGIPAIGGS